MKRFITSSSAILVALLTLLAGCTSEQATQRQEVPTPDNGGKTITFRYNVGVETYAPIPAYDYEKNVATLQAVLFDGTTNAFEQLETLPNITEQNSSFSFRTNSAKTYKMVLVANHTLAEADLAGKVIDDLQNIIVTSAPDVENSFVMVSPVHTVTTQEQQATNAGQIHLKRLSARYDISTDSELLSLKSVTFTNRKTESQLFSSTNTDSRATDNKPYTSFSSMEKNRQGQLQRVASTRTSKGQMYSYENSVAGASDPTSPTTGTTVTIVANYGGVELKPLVVPMPAITRNYIYHIRLSVDGSDDMSKTKLSYEIEVVDWFDFKVIRVDKNTIIEDVNKNQPGVSYAITSSTPNLTFAWDGEANKQQIRLSATKQPLRGNQPDPNQPATTITAPAQFNFEVDPAASSWLSVAADGSVSVLRNSTQTARTGSISITLKEDTEKSTTYAVQVTQNAAPAVTRTYSLTGVTPTSRTFDWNEVNRAVTYTLNGYYQDFQGSHAVGTRWQLTAADYQVRITPAATWLTVDKNASSFRVSAINTTTADRTARIEFRLNKNASATNPDAVITVTQKKQVDLKYNVLSYVAEFNARSNGEFETAHSIPASSSDRNVLMDWQTAMNLYNTPKQMADGKIYHLPSRWEWAAIVPYNGEYYTRFDTNRSDNNISEQVRIPGASSNITHTSDYRSTTGGVAYAIRFKGTDYESAWRYEWTTVGGLSGLRISAVNTKGVAITTISNSTWWSNTTNTASMVVRFFPAAGNSGGNQGTDGYYWSSTEYSSGDAYGTHFGSGTAYGDYYWGKSYARSVRLFAPVSLEK